MAWKLMLCGLLSDMLMISTLTLYDLGARNSSV